MNTETVWMSVIILLMSVINLCILLVKCLTEIGKHNLNLP